MKIVKATIDHLDELTALFNGYRIFYKKESDGNSVREFLSERLAKDDSTIFVSFDEQVMTGFTQLYPLFSSVRMKKLWLLNDLYVDEKFRGKGHSKALIDKAKELCVQSDSCGFMLETTKDNIVGNNLYGKIGLSLDTEHNVYSWDVK